MNAPGREGQVEPSLDGYYARVQETAASIRRRAGRAPEIGVVLGSGLGEFAAGIEQAVSIPYDALPHWPRSGVMGHEGRLVIGRLEGASVAALSGRAHYYEGHDLMTVTFPTRVLALLGVKVLLLTNAAGGINTSFEPGSLMVIDDHVNLMGVNPLRGPNDDRFGPRFPDMSEVYSRRLRAAADEAARGLGLRLLHGTYVAVHGPSYETPAEIRAFRALGIDAVGMSTVPEAIVARHMGLEVLGISCISNMAAGVLPRPLSHEEVFETARRVGPDVARLLTAIVARVHPAESEVRDVRDAETQLQPDRRVGERRVTERRTRDRRTREAGPSVGERRRGQDRRTGERRSGRDRRGGKK